jgi:uncharacterized membrane protein
MKTFTAFLTAMVTAAVYLAMQIGIVALFGIVLWKHEVATFFAILFVILDIIVVIVIPVRAKKLAREQGCSIWEASAKPKRFQSQTQPMKPVANNDALNRLRKRLANGEITADEYKQMKEVLEN